MRSPLLFLAVPVLVGVLSACGSSPTQPIAGEAQTDAAAPLAGEEPSVIAEPSPGEAEEDESLQPEVAQRPFPDDSLYALLVAEFALRRRDYDVALDNYMSQSELLQDRSVSAHTTRLAQFMNRDEDALKASQLWVELDPDNLEARLTLANLLARYGRSREALPHMEYIVRAGGTANFTALARGFSELDSAQRQAFQNSIDTLLNEFPDNSQLRICKVLLLEEQGDSEQALKELQPIFDNEPEQLQAVVLDAKLRLDLDKPEKAFSRIEPILAEQPENNRLRMQYARLLTRTDLDRAEQQFRFLVEQAPGDPDLLFSLALIQRETQDLDGAKESLKKLLAINARTDEAHYYLGKTAEDQQRWEDALTHYMQVQPGRDFGAATDRIAHLLLAAGQSAELGAYFDHLRERFPQLNERLFALESEKLASYRHNAEALQLLDRALQQFPSSTGLRYSRSMLYEQEGSLVLAEQDLRLIIEREPDNATALNALGYTLANRTERFEEAAELIARAIALSPEEPAILDSMGWVAYRLGNYNEALNYLRQAYSAFPDPEVAAHLGEVLWAMGDNEAALLVWNQARTNNPKHKVLNETMQRFGVEQDES